MYKCSITKKVSKPGKKLTRLVVSTRQKIYEEYIRNEETRQLEKVQVGSGWEIVKEIPVSEEGLAMWNAWSEEQRNYFINHN